MTNAPLGKSLTYRVRHSGCCLLSSLGIASFMISLVAITAILQAEENLQVLEQQVMQRAVEIIAPAVVQIEAFGGRERIGQMLVGTGPTTGIVITADGYIVSSAFNFVQQPSSILVTLSDGRRFPARIAARDHSRMLVLLKIQDVEDLQVPTAVPRTEMQVGQWAISVGNTFDGPVSRSVGILSATNRIWGKAIQTDAKVSPNNYGGPLSDLQGRVLGILVPLSPQGRGEIAGTEWYDSGIGFAIPLVDVLEVIDRWKSGEDLHPGVMGISLVGKDMFTTPARIAACLPNSPASAAGLKADDVIIQIDGHPIERQVQLKHVLGPKYAGQQVNVVALRGDERIETEVLLTDAIDPYEHPFLGILPRHDRQDQIVVSHVFAGSPAHGAGIRVGDTILQIGQREIRSTTDCWEAFAAMESRQRVPLVLERSGTKQVVEATLVPLASDIPDSPAPSNPAEHVQPAERPPVGVVEIKVPEFSNECVAYVPQNYNPDRRYGLVVWLHNPGQKFDRDQLIEVWKDHCHQRDLILVAPQPTDASRWHPIEIRMLRKAIDQVASRYEIDEARVAAAGNEVGGSMAFMLAFSNLDRIRGVVAIDAPLPARIRVPATDPLRRLSIYMSLAPDSKVKQRVEANADQLKQLKYPVTLQPNDSLPGPDTSAVASDIIHWIDVLDRI